MINLKTNYLGLELKNPIIVGASDLVSVIRRQYKGTPKMPEHAAIVYKSLFEEQIQLERYQLDEDEMNIMNGSRDDRPFPSVDHAGPKEFLLHLRRARERFPIPLSPA